jgi:squalene-hopene/tetraprenyl-beta-curcumene cyclase
LTLEAGEADNTKQQPTTIVRSPAGGISVREIGWMRALPLVTCILGSCFAASLFAQPAASPTDSAGQWNGKAAAAYLDQRITWWMNWPSAARDHETFCVSCHTAAPYAIARPSLRHALGEQAPSALERKLLDNVTKRVRMWKEVEPFYPTKKDSDPKTIESRGTESILNALILASNDAAAGALSADGRLALDNMWGEQLKTGDAAGAWNWLQFHNSPWEGDSQYYGATLAAIAAGTALGNYRSSADIQDRLKLLSDYLVRERDSQVTINRVMLLWASAKLPVLLTRAQQTAIVTEALGKQKEDGGFSLSSFVGEWKRRDNTPLDPRSDGYATGLVVFALEQTGMGDRSQLKRGLEWLASNQDAKDGGWQAWSLNKQRDPASDAGRFMSDAATAYAALALSAAH